MMPKISIIIPAYNIEHYISECLASVSAQTYEDFEAIVVDDASSDTTGSLADEAASHDNRIQVIHHEHNLGTHLTRGTGVSHASGQYSFFLDGDDALQKDMLQKLSDEIDHKPADILHYGITAIAANNLQDEELQTFENFNNKPTPEATGLDILQDIFDDGRGHRVDWRFTQRLYRTALLRQSFNIMTKKRLGRSQDAYECFVTSALAQSYRPIKNCKGYVYYYGRGISGTSIISADKYGQYCQDFKANFDSAFEFAHASQSRIILECAEGFEHKATELLANDWLNRITENDKAAAAADMKAVFGPAITGREVYRCIRDRAYDFIAHNIDLQRDDRLYSWMKIASSLAVNSAPQTQLRRYRQMRDTALEHMDVLYSNTEREHYNEQNIRIFVTTHKLVDKPHGAIFQTVQVGDGLKTNRFAHGFHDDDGENISDKNPSYSELTTQYWAWKNIDSEYYGFCHYRRYFDFSATSHKENDYGEVIDDFIDDNAIAKYQLTDEAVKESVKGYDIITTGIKDLRRTIDRRGNPINLYRAAPYLHVKDLHTALQIIEELFPDYKDAAKQFFSGHYSCFCNMYIMRKKQFFAYCQWLFPILEEFERRTDMATYSKEALRTPGHLAERLFNIWLIHEKHTNPALRAKELQCVHFMNPEQLESPKPLNMVGDEDDIVPVVFAANNNYVPMVTTTIYSVLENAREDRFYDITILERDISQQNKTIMRKFFDRYTNMNLRFVDVTREMANYHLTTANDHISVETYYRFLIQQLLPFYDKVIYLDSDIIVRGDVSQLYDSSTDGKLLAAVRDIDYLGNLNMKDGKRLRYSKTILRMSNPYDYFQAGVLVLNTKAMRQRYSMKQWLRLASNPGYIYNDQDVLNAECEGSVSYIDWSWDVLHDCDERVSKVFTFAPKAAYDAYMKSRENPRIIHYAGYIKPWTAADCDFADTYWKYARQTPFYEHLLERLIAGTAAKISGKLNKSQQSHQRLIPESSRVRDIIDPIAPLGSKRREIIKNTVRSIHIQH